MNLTQTVNEYFAYDPIASGMKSASIFLTVLACGLMATVVLCGLALCMLYRKQAAAVAGVLGLVFTIGALVLVTPYAMDQGEVP